MERIQDKTWLGYLLALGASLVLILVFALPRPAQSVPEPVLTGVAQTLAVGVNTPEPSPSRPPIATAAPPTPSPEPTPTVYASPTFMPTVTVPDGLSLTVLHPWQNEAGAAFDALVEAFNRSSEANLYKVNLTAQRANGFEDLAQILSEESLASDIVVGYGYDLAFMDRGDYWARQGGLIPINPLRDSAAVLTQGEVCGGCASAGEESREQRIVPLLWQPALLAWNATWASDLGFESPPTDIDELRQQSAAARQALLEDNIYENNGSGGLLLSQDPKSALAWYQAFGGQFDPALPYPKPEQAAFEASAKFLKQAFTENLSWSRGYLSSQAYFAQRWALTYEAGLEDIPLQNGELAYYANQDEWQMIPYPSPEGQGSLSLESVAAAVKSSDQARQQAAWSFVRFLLSRESQKALAELSWLWPVIGQPAEVAPEFAQANPAWASALSGEPLVHFAPETRNWAISRLVYQDAMARVYPLDMQYLGNVLVSLDATLQEMVKRNE